MDHSERTKMRRLMWRWGGTLDYVCRKERELKQLWDAIADAYDTLRAQNIDGMPHVKNAAMASSVERAIEAVQQRIDFYEEFEASIRDEIKTAIKLKASIDTAVGELDAGAQKILRLRYIDGHKWTFIAMKTSYDESWARAVEKKSLEQLTKRISFSEMENSSVL